jgi:hypothetical protein
LERARHRRHHGGLAAMVAGPCATGAPARSVASACRIRLCRGHGCGYAPMTFDVFDVLVVLAVLSAIVVAYTMASVRL